MSLDILENPDEGKDFKRCNGCHLLTYCDQDCQREHWQKVHKRHCGLLSGQKQANYSQHKKENCSQCFEEINSSANEIVKLGQLVKLDKMPRKAKLPCPVGKKLVRKVKLGCLTCDLRCKNVHNYHRHLKSKKHLGNLRVNQIKANKINRKLGLGLQRAVNVPVPKLCLNCVTAKSSETLSKYCDFATKEPVIKRFLKEKLEEVYFKTESSVLFKMQKLKAYYCKVCNVPFSSQSTSTNHYSGKSHIKSLLKMIKSQLSCVVCGNITVIFNSEEKAAVKESDTKVECKIVKKVTLVKTEYIEPDTESDFKMEHLESDLKAESSEKLDGDVNAKCTYPDIKKDFFKEDIKECFKKETVDMETDIKKEFFGKDIKKGCFKEETKEIETDINKDLFGEDLKRECFEEDVKTEYIELDMKQENIKVNKHLTARANRYQCNVCEIEFSSPKVFKAHFIDDAHVKKLERMIQKTDLFYCDFCDFSTVNEETFKRHLDDQLHLYEVKAHHDERNQQHKKNKK